MPPVRRVELPEQGVAEAPDLPAGVVLVRVVDPQGRPLPDVRVRLGAMREGEHQAAREVRTRVDGVAQFDHLETGTNISYRASVEYEGARFSSPPFQLSPNVGEHVQIVRFPVENDPRSVLISDARVEITFNDDRLLVVQRVTIVNFSSMSISGQEVRPMAFVPREGLRFRLPRGFLAFRADEESLGMSDLRMTEEGGYAVLRGSILPMGAQQEGVSVAFQYRIKLDSSDIPLDLALPLPVLRATVVSQAPQGMRLEVEGMPQAEERTHNGQRILITGRERRSREDPALGEIHVRLAGIPPAAGPERAMAALAAAGIALGSVFAGVRNHRRRAGAPRDPALLRERKRRLLEEAAELGRAHAQGEVGPETYGRRRREIALELAAVLKDLAETKSEMRA